MCALDAAVRAGKASTSGVLLLLARGDCRGGLGILRELGTPLLIHQSVVLDV